jgi:hypothetical protein
MLAKLDGRTKQARRLREIKDDLIRHVGGADRVTAPQRYLIDRCAVDIFRLELLDAAMTAGTFTETDGVIAHALRNSMRLTLRELGLKPVAPAPPSLAEHLARRAAEREAAERAA